MIPRRGSALVVLVLLGACAPRPFSPPQLVAGDSRTVSFQAGQWSDATPAAESYCSNYGKSAKPKGRTPLNRVRSSVDLLFQLRRGRPLDTLRGSDRMGQYHETYRGAIYPWHCDHQGHLTVQHYFGFFDAATWQLLSALGFTSTRLAEEKRGFVDVTATINYVAEQHAGDRIHIESALSRLGTTSVTAYHRMLNSESGDLAATLENVMLYFDLEARQKIPLPDADKARLQTFLVATIDD